MDDLSTDIQKFRLHLRVSDALQRIQQTFWIALTAAIIIQIIGHLTPIPNLQLWTLLPIGIWSLLTITHILWDRPTKMEIAQRVDLELKLKERLSTALALQEIPNQFPQHFLQAQLKDALRFANKIDPVKAFPIKPLNKHLLFTGTSLFCLILLVAIPNPMKEQIARQTAIAVAAEKQADQIDELKVEIENNQVLKDQEREDLLRQLSDLSEALRQNSGNLEQALSDLSTIESTLQSKIDPQARVKAANLESLLSRLSSLSDQYEQFTGEDSGAKELEQLAEQVNDMNPDQRQELAKELAEMAANASQAGNKQLATSLSSLSLAVQTADQNTIKNATQNVQAAIEQTQSLLQSQEAYLQALSQIQSSSQSLALAGQDGIQSSNPTRDQSPNPGSGQDQNQGQSQVSGGGSKSDTLPPNTGQGQAGIPEGLPDSSDPSDPSSQIYVPRLEGTENSEQLFIQGQDTGFGGSQVSPGDSSLPGSLNPSLIPYIQVFPTYRDAAYQAMRQFYIPPSLESYIRQYFSQLEP